MRALIIFFGKEAGHAPIATSQQWGGAATPPRGP